MPTCPTSPQAGTKLTRTGALLIAAALIGLAVGLIQNGVGSKADPVTEIVIDRDGRALSVSAD